MNLVGGDIYSGSCALDQNLLWRPRPSLPGHRTPVVGLYHIGASTHPGPGLGAGSGTIVAHDLLREKPGPRARSTSLAAWEEDGSALTLDQNPVRVG